MWPKRYFSKLYWTGKYWPPIGVITEEPEQIVATAAFCHARIITVLRKVKPVYEFLHPTIIELFIKIDAIREINHGEVVMDLKEIHPPQEVSRPVTNLKSIIEKVSVNREISHEAVVVGISKIKFRQEIARPSSNLSFSRTSIIEKFDKAKKCY